MTIEALLDDKTKKAKQKVETISGWLLEGSLQMEELIVFAQKAKDPDKANCVEAIEFATKQRPAIGDENLLAFLTSTLLEKAPRLKWEAAKVIGNIAPLFPTKLNKAISALLTNTEHEGTVVRWASAYALGEILKLNTKHNKDLLPAIEAICKREQNNGVKKKYLDALKKTKK